MISGRKGQVMILTILAIGGVLLGATAVAGLLMVFQLRQTTDIANSQKAIFAADAGIEWGLYQFFHPSSTRAQPSFTNGASFTTACTPTADCRLATTTKIQAVGSAVDVRRSFELDVQLEQL